jgi:hypothetical protein
MILAIALSTHCARQVKAILEHLEARNLIARDREDDGELGVGYVARRLDPRCEFTDDHGSVWAGKDVLDLEFDRLCQQADIAEEVCGGLPPGFASDPWEYTLVALDFEAKIFGEHGGESFGGAALANAGEKLLGDHDILVLAHGYPFCI